MLTRLIQRTDSVSEIEYEYEYRDAEYEKSHEQSGDRGRWCARRSWIVSSREGLGY